MSLSSARRFWSARRARALPLALGLRACPSEALVGAGPFAIAFATDILAGREVAGIRLVFRLVIALP